MSLRGLLLGLVVLATAGFIVGTTIERNSGESRHESAATLRAEGKTAGSESKATRASETGDESKATHAAQSSGHKTHESATAAESTAIHGAERAPKPTHAAIGGESAATHSAENAAKTTHAAASSAEGKASHQAEIGGEKKKRTTTPPSSQTSAERETSQPAEIGASAAVAHTSRSDTVQHAELKPLGVNVEAVPFVGLAVASSIALALAVWIRPRMVLLLLGMAGAMLVFALLDIREVSHQSDEARTGLAVLAGAIAALHLAAAVVASLMARVAAVGTLALFRRRDI